MPSPPKPWETKGNSAQASFNGNAAPSSSSTPFPPTDSSANSAQPPLPSRPDFGSSTTSNIGLGNNTSSYGLGSSSYGSGYGSGYGSSYGSGYGSMYGSSYGSGYGGGMGSMYGSGYGSGYGSSYGSGYGSMYGGGYGSGMGSMYGGMGGYGMNRYGPYNRMGMNGGRMGPEDPSFAHQMQLSTQSTFQLLERVVGTFGGIAQMLESTYFATHSSFMAMVGVADHFGMLRNSLAQMFSLFAIYRSVRNFLYRLVGKRPPISPNEISTKEFKKFSEKPKYSFRPFLMFLGLVFGVPYLLHLFMKSMARRMAKKQQELLKSQGLIGPNGMPQQTFEFAKASYDFKGQNSNELNFFKDDLIAILSKGSPTNTNGAAPQWWQGRTRDGKVGMFPSNYVEILEKKIDMTSNPNLNNANLNLGQTQFQTNPMINNSMGSMMNTSTMYPNAVTANNQIPFSTPFQGSTFDPPPPIV
ncbi:hypothetical protein K502DRAFT_324363 [Neoconidiobolus thromboides FSU 785]|nr:hypothetical protein K502DRAFT_324363 [Neoconidiobolus thromboides FSU 785]